MTRPEPDLRVVSFGGGIQSTALCLMADQGLIAGGAKPDVAFFADTGWEPPHVYETVAAVRDRVSYDVEVVSSGKNLAHDVFNGEGIRGHKYIPIPVFLKLPDGRQVMNHRQCTSGYKIEPIDKAIRLRLGVAYRKHVPKGTLVVQWMGISEDEALRMKPNRKKYIENQFPLVEHKLTRQDCSNWLTENYPDIPVGKSACVGCPYQSKDAWRKMAADYPVEFAKAVEIDKQMRTEGHNEKVGDAYLHRRMLPLDEAVAIDLSSGSLFEDGLEGEECDGVCFG